MTKSQYSKIFLVTPFLKNGRVLYSFKNKAYLKRWHNLLIFVILNIFIQLSLVHTHKSFLLTGSAGEGSSISSQSNFFCKRKLKVRERMFTLFTNNTTNTELEGMRWASGRVLYLRLKGIWFKTYWRHELDTLFSA